MAVVVAAGLLLGIGACASTGTGGGSNRDLITLEEIQASQASNVYQLIQSTRGSWLSSRGPMSFRTGEDDGLEQPEIIVYMDGTRLGDVGDLQGVSIVGITGIQRLSASEATQRFGTGHARGAILISRGS